MPGCVNSVRSSTSRSKRSSLPASSCRILIATGCSVSRSRPRKTWPSPPRRTRARSSNREARTVRGFMDGTDEDSWNATDFPALCLRDHPETRRDRARNDRDSRVDWPTPWLAACSGAFWATTGSRLGRVPAGPGSHHPVVWLAPAWLPATHAARFEHACQTCPRTRPRVRPALDVPECLQPGPSNMNLPRLPDRIWAGSGPDRARSDQIRRAAQQNAGERWRRVVISFSACPSPPSPWCLAPCLLAPAASSPPQPPRPAG